MTIPAPLGVGRGRMASPVGLEPIIAFSSLPGRTRGGRNGWGLHTNEMMASQAAIGETRQSIQKAAWHPLEEPVSMQLVGCTAHEMGEAAKLAADKGAAIIDINTGCPVRKIVNGLAG